MSDAPNHTYRLLFARQWKAKHGRDSVLEKQKTTAGASGGSAHTNEKYSDTNMKVYEDMMKKGMFRKAENFLDEMYMKG